MDARRAMAIEAFMGVLSGLPTADPHVAVVGPNPTPRATAATCAALLLMIALREKETA